MHDNSLILNHFDGSYIAVEGAFEQKRYDLYLVFDSDFSVKLKSIVNGNHALNSLIENYHAHKDHRINFYCLRSPRASQGYYPALLN